MRKTLAVTLMLLATLILGCPSSGPTLPPTTSGGGFFIQTLTSFDLAPPVVAPNVQVKLSWNNDLPQFGTPVGSAATVSVTTNSAGVGIVSNGRVPANWHFLETFSLTAPCQGQSFDEDVKEIDDDIGLLCTVTDFSSGAQSATVAEASAYSFSPTPIATDGSSGSEAIISGPGFSQQYGMPIVQYFDLNGNFVTQASADAIAADGSWMSSPVPDISQLAYGSYVGFLKNANANGNYDILGAVSVEVVSPPPPPPEPDPDLKARI